MSDPEFKLFKFEKPPARQALPLDGGGGGPHDSDMSSRIAKMEGQVDGLKTAAGMVTWAIGIGFTVVIFAVGFLGVQTTSVANRMDSGFASVGSKLDRLPEALATEFRAIRQETSGQTSAIAQAITAAKNQVPQVIILPASAVNAPQQLDPKRDFEFQYKPQ